MQVYFTCKRESEIFRGWVLDALIQFTIFSYMIFFLAGNPQEWFPSKMEPSNHFILVDSWHSEHFSPVAEVQGRIWQIWKETNWCLNCWRLSWCSNGNLKELFWFSFWKPIILYRRKWYMYSKYEVITFAL